MIQDFWISKNRCYKRYRYRTPKNLNFGHKKGPKIFILWHNRYHTGKWICVFYRILISENSHSVLYWKMQCICFRFVIASRLRFFRNDPIWIFLERRTPAIIVTTTCIWDLASQKFGMLSWILIFKVKHMVFLSISIFTLASNFYNIVTIFVFAGSRLLLPKRRPPSRNALPTWRACPLPEFYYAMLSLNIRFVQYMK
jgi:hypothetical protein